MKTEAFFREDRDDDIARWARSIGPEMTDVWDAMIAQGKHIWLIQTAARAFGDSAIRLLAVRFVRETPLSDGRHVADLLDDARSLAALATAEAYALGKATEPELVAARNAARAAAEDIFFIPAWAAARAATRAAGDYSIGCAIVDASEYAVWAAARTRDNRTEARAAQIAMVAALGNPFRGAKP